MRLRLSCVIRTMCDCPGPHNLSHQNGRPENVGLLMLFEFLHFLSLSPDGVNSLLLLLAPFDVHRYSNSQPLRYDKFSSRELIINAVSHAKRISKKDLLKESMNGTSKLTAFDYTGD